MRLHTIITLAASTVIAASVRPLPTDIGFLINQVAELMDGTPYYAELSQAAQSLISNYQLSGKDAQNQEIVSSLFAVLNSQNVAAQATSIAGSIVTVLEGDGPAGKLESLISSAVADLRNPAVNTQIANIVDRLIGLLEQAHSVAPEMFDDGPTAGPTPTPSSTGTRTSPNAQPSTHSGVTVSSSTTKSSSSES
ncbi:hypothetical protein GGI24_006960, partial [Coemansia furcata]